jgi:hypothetical protein
MIINLKANLIFWKANMKIDEIDEERGKKKKKRPHVLKLLTIISHAPLVHGDDVKTL